jgi:hypothetical protein
MVQWALLIPNHHNPLIDSTGERYAEGQNGPVSFLAETTGKTHLAELMYYSKWKGYFISYNCSQFSYSEVPTFKIDEELISYTAKGIISWNLSIIDRLKLHDLDKYRTQFTLKNKKIYSQLHALQRG